VPLKAGDQVRVRQKNGLLQGNWTSPPVIVTGPQTDPVVEISNGFEHSAVNVPVFYRGVLTTGKYGPWFRAVMCGAQSAIVRIIAPVAGDPQEVKVIKLAKIKEGYFEGGWDWKNAGWTIPDDIPIGEYTAAFEVTSSLGTSKKNKKFFVAFDPMEIRNNIVTASKNFIPSKYFGCGSGGCTGKYIGSGLNESEVNKFFTGGAPPWTVDCLGASRIVMARGLILTLKSGEFDKILHTSSNMHYTTSNMALKATHGLADISQTKIGDWGYIRNDWNYLSKHPGGAFQGENVIKVGPSLYWGFGTSQPNRTYEQWKQELIDAYNFGLAQSEHISSIPGFTGDIQFFDVIQVSVDVWNHRKNP
jgi:hypothetical protein